MKVQARWILVTVVLSLAVLFSMTFPLPVVQGAAEDVRWDIINRNPTTTPPTVSAGGIAFASADANHTIKFTGSGTFVAPASGGTSNAATGGGTWETFTSGVSTGSGTYFVTSLASWQFASFQTAGALNDLIGTVGLMATQFSESSIPTVAKASWASVAKVLERLKAFRKG